MNSNASPWYSSVPDLVITFTRPPECSPPRAPRFEDSTLNSCTASGKGKGRLAFDM